MKLKDLIVTYYPIQHRLTELARLETKLNQELTPKSEYHPGLRYVVRLGTKRPRDIFLLWIVRECLPVSIRMEVERQFEALNESLNVTDLMLAWAFVDKFTSEEDLRFLNGRASGKLYDVLGKIRLNLEQSPRPKTHQRPRGYKDHGSLASEQTKSDRQLAKEVAAEKDSRRTYDDLQKLQLSRASEILLKEREGDSSEVIQETTTPLLDRLSAFNDVEARFEVENAGCRFQEEAGFDQESFERMYPGVKLPCDLCPGHFRTNCRTFVLYSELRPKTSS